MAVSGIGCLNFKLTYRTLRRSAFRRAFCVWDLEGQAQLDAAAAAIVAGAAFDLMRRLARAQRQQHNHRRQPQDDRAASMLGVSHSLILSPAIALSLPPPP
jgi:hypothetical protein